MVKIITLINNSRMQKCFICSQTDVYPKNSVGTFSYYLCNNCFTLYLVPIPEKKVVSFYYESDFLYSAGLSHESKIRDQSRKILANLKKLRPNGSTLCDIGSGYGFFVEEALKYNFQVVGIEPAKELIKYTQKKNLPISRTNLAQFIKTHKKKYDFVTLIHVIEHVVDPLKLIKNALQLLKPNGILYIETPNLNSHLYQAEQNIYIYLTPPDHICIFSLKSFQFIISKISNINIFQTSTYSYPEHFMGILKSYFQSSINYHDSLKTKKSNQKVNKIKIPNIKYLFFDKLLAPLLTPILNMGGKGSILELYIRKS